MALNILQLTLALTPAVLISMVIQRMSLPWEKKHTVSERSELLSMLAKDVKRVKAIMAENIAAVNAGRACAITPLPLTNWKKLKRTSRLQKYSHDPVVKKLIRQFREWEQAT